MKKSLLTKALLTFSVIGTVFAFSNTVKAADNYELVWSDEFNGNSLDTNTWNYEIGTGSWGWGNNEQQYYTVLVSIFDQQVVFVRRGCRVVEKLRLFQQSACRTLEIGEIKGFQQVVHGRNPVALRCVFRVGGGKDHHRRVRQGGNHLHAVQVGHIDVHE